jgi:hypothetical protein
MDIIGIMYEPSLVEGQDPVVIPGYHVNTPEPVEGWEGKQVTPETPMRVYGGRPTFFYSFADEAEFTQMAIEEGLLPAPEPEPVVADIVEGV